MTHPLALGIMIIVFGLGIGLGLLIYAVKGETPSGAARTPSVVTMSQDAALDGRMFGFVSSIESSGSKAYLSFDAANWLTGEAALNAAITAGVCTPERPKECLPNDYFIENNSGETAWHLIAPDVLITMETLHHDSSGSYRSGEVISFSEFRQLFENPQTASLWRRLPFWITLSEGGVTRIEEQYVP